MILTPLVRKALEIATEAHKGQVDKGGNPYILHPMFVADKMKDEVRTIVALLHDVVEDNKKWTLERLAFFGEEVVEALDLLNHDDDVPYDEYIKNLSVNPIARDVKMGDLEHNSDLTRLKVITQKDRKRAQKYKRSIIFLEGVEEQERSHQVKQKMKRAM